ncbi:hypothetical protein FA13DRAFT_874021 [Coprinellus micaceus]|uniref:CBM1 domain-containing protein n=1 Tax=Coprinellus micaceus TaxID=71717 RepID=A0A4Y7T0T0_COPMI|nr:hypothetical protein FA13DRAFT_874021 [Coprinellus micaceus]
MYPLAQGYLLFLAFFTAHYTVCAVHAKGLPHATPAIAVSLPIPVSVPTPPPDARAIIGDGYVRPGCSTFTCRPCTGEFDVGLAATGSTDCHFCACFPRTSIPSSCSLTYCGACGWSTTVTLTTPMTGPYDCPKCGCLPPVETGILTAVSLYGQCGGIGWAGLTKCQRPTATPSISATCSTIHSCGRLWSE